jgi:hypothetical protein
MNNYKPYRFTIDTPHSPLGKTIALDIRFEVTRNLKDIRFLTDDYLRYCVGNEVDLDFPQKSTKRFYIEAYKHLTENTNGLRKVIQQLMAKTHDKEALLNLNELDSDCYTAILYLNRFSKTLLKRQPWQKS